MREARHKAEIILKDANLKAERVVSSAESEIGSQKKQLEELKKETTKFRSSLLDLYKEHLTLIKAIPSYKEEPAAAVPSPRQRRLRSRNRLSRQKSLNRKSLFSRQHRLRTIRRS